MKQKVKARVDKGVFVAARIIDPYGGWSSLGRAMRLRAADVKKHKKWR